MNSKIVHQDGAGTFVLVFETGEEVMRNVAALAKMQRLRSGKLHRNRRLPAHDLGPLVS